VLSRHQSAAATHLGPAKGASELKEPAVLVVLMAKRRQRRVRAQLDELLASARRNEQSAPRKHHVLPACYLRRWAVDGLIRVTTIDESHEYSTSPEKAARETDFYRLEGESLDPQLVAPNLFEHLLSGIEGWGNEAIEHLLTSPRTMDPRKQAALALFLGIQLTRGAGFRAELRQHSTNWFRLKYGDLNDKGIQSYLRSQGVEPSEENVASSRDFLAQLRAGSLTIAPQNAALIAQAAEMGTGLGERLLTRAWVLCATQGTMPTCDEPVVLIGGPGQPRTERSGIETAGVIAFPLSPCFVLAMIRADLASRMGFTGWEDSHLFLDQLDHVEDAELCREIVGNAHRWAFELPNKRRAARLTIPPLPEASTADDVGTVVADGEEGTLIRVSKANRWRNARRTPAWPVQRWWAAAGLAPNP
jgi:hypothetical protein